MKKADGTCIACAEYTKKKDSKTCEADTCTGRNRLTKAGTCVACDDYLKVKADSGTKVCEQPLCKSGDTEQVNYVVKTDGTCEKCADYFKAGKDKRSCVPGALTDAQPKTQWILQKDGTAKECEYAKPDATKEETVNDIKVNVACKDTVCEADAATDAILRKKIAKNGDCETCGDYEKRDPADAKACIKQTCATAGFVPDLVAKCVDPQDTFIVALPATPEGKTEAEFKADIKKARDDINKMLLEVKASMAALTKAMTAQIKVAFGLV